MTKALTKTKETPKQRNAFLIYFNLGEKRSLENARREIAKLTPKKVPALRTVKVWSSKYKWVERVQTMDQEVQDKAESLAIKKATIRKSQVLTAVKNTMIKYNDLLLKGDIVPSPSDFKKMWEIHRKEMGLDTGEEPSPIKVEINQRILTVILKAEDDAKKIIEQEIQNE